MDDRQLQIATLLMSYFTERRDTAISLAAGGVQLVKLNSAEARTQFGGRDDLQLTFDPDQAFQHPDLQLINGTHPFLDVIRNDLTSGLDDPRLSEGHFGVQPVSPTGVVSIPHLTIDGPVSAIDFTVDHRPYFILSFKVVFEADERHDYVLRMCFDGLTGERRDAVVPNLSRATIDGGRPSSVGGDVRLVDLETVLRDGRAEVERRVRLGIAAVAGRYAAELSNEKARLQQHYASEIELSERTSKKDEDGRRRLRENLAKEIEDFEAKYRCTSRASLLSVLLLWSPVVRYKLALKGSRSEFWIDDVVYEGCTDAVTAEACAKCGSQGKLRVCAAGEHVLCGESGCVEIASCAVCEDSYCPAHGKRCAGCKQPSCAADQSRCAYGKHPRGSVFCARCASNSFEDKAICPACGEACLLCGRLFPPALLRVCAVGGERFCASHAREVDGDTCSECGEAVCRNHGTTTADGSWVCSRHAHAATCCGRLFGDSRLARCIDDSNELLCSEHRSSCTVCHEPVCSKHALQSWRGEPLCSRDARQCARCPTVPAPKIHRRDKVWRCAVCNETVCAEHLQKCPVCEATAFCRIHHDQQPRCESCSRVSCGTAKCGATVSGCRLCGMHYCQRCVSAKGICQACQNAAPVSRAGDAFAVLEKVVRSQPEPIKRSAQEFLKAFRECTSESGANATYQVFVIHRRASKLLFWRRDVTLRVVVKSGTTIVQARFDERTS